MSSLPPAAQRPPVRANERFQAHAANLLGHDTEAIFTYLHRTAPETDTAADTAELLRREIPALLRRYRARTLLDLPCGDPGWLSHADLRGITYTGGDIVPDIVTSNSRRYGGTRRHFVRPTRGVQRRGLQRPARQMPAWAIDESCSSDHESAHRCIV